ncbi:MULTISPECIES: S8 family serine peptidase [Winogradskyella]|uniref:S8 family serine peptidase n=1 Tax=Winogradskyella TaxID=286104 RepID=UPI0015CD239A|nr:MULTISPECIES: S8 family serine peptidase [Winogradskyella]QXP77796.1 S8 family serine peptidase [Winogradskyella sp. HaHa_3_26]
MKKICFVIVCVISFNIYSQNESEVKEILRNTDVASLESLKADFLKQQKVNDDIINAYVIANNVPRIIKDGDKVMEIRKIVNNKPVYISTDNLGGARTSRTNFVQAGGDLGLNLTGNSMYIGIWDGGSVLATHNEFRVFGGGSRVETPDAASSLGISNHGTHVTGTIGASGVNSSAKGMATATDMISYDWNGDSGEVINEITNNGLLLSNHSYGIPIENATAANIGTYNSEARSWDQIAYSAPYYLQVVSAGNDGSNTYTGGNASGYDKLVGEKNSKNNLIVANADDPVISTDGNGTLLSLNISSSSSQGPSDDGRVKPDISADGNNVFSTYSTDDSAYGRLSGTSMASPTIAGSLLLMQEYYNQLHSNFMRSATLKGLACHTADDDVYSIGPDPIFGWGLINIKAMAETIADAVEGTAVLSEETLNSSQTFTYTFTSTGSSPIIATICWTDPAGTDRSGILNDTDPVLVNDLDLRITQGDTTYMPWKLNSANVTQSATKGDNIVDNVERININSGEVATYTLTVTHKNPFLTGGTQPFSLILTGSDLVLSNSDFEYDEFSIWPNPSKGEFNIRFNNNNSSENVKIDVYDISGRLVYKNTYTNNSYQFNETINLTDVASGVYLANISQGNTKTTKKIIIE